MNYSSIDMEDEKDDGEEMGGGYDRGSALRRRGWEGGRASEQYRKEDLGEVGEEERVGEENGVNEVREEREGEGGRGEKEF